MSGHVDGVQTWIHAITTKPQYVHYHLHVLNICILHLSKVRIVPNVMDTMTEIYVAF